MAGMMGWGLTEQGWRRGPWTAEEDKLLIEYVTLHGEGRWSSVARSAGLNRSGKSCRLRWVNYLKPGLKRGQITPQEERIIIELHGFWGNKWATIARCLPGRTDNEIKNYWRTHFKKSSKSQGKKISSRQQQIQMKKHTQQPERQQEQLLVQQFQQLNQQQKQEQLLNDMKGILSHFTEGDQRLCQSDQKQNKQEFVFFRPALNTDQCLPLNFQEGTHDTLGEENFWNWDLVPGLFNSSNNNNSNKVATQNQFFSL